MKDTQKKTTKKASATTSEQQPAATVDRKTQRPRLDSDYFNGIFIQSRQGVVANYIMEQRPIEQTFLELNKLHDLQVKQRLKDDAEKTETQLFELGVLVSVAKCINDGEIQNLSDIVWESVTNSWSTYGIEVFVRSIENQQLRVLVLDCMIEQYRYRHNPNGLTTDFWEQDFLQFCNDLKTHMQHYEAYNVEAVLKSNADLKRRVSNLESAVYRHYSSTLTDEQLQIILQTLTSNNYLAADTDFAAWVWVCTGRGENVPTEPLKWISQQNLLACAVDELFGNTNTGDLWEIAAACFILNGDKKPNIDAMKNSKGRTSNEKKETLLNLLKQVRRQKEK